MSFAGIEEAVEEIRQGRMVIVVDDEDRENEGDLTIAADKITPEAINFMATVGLEPAMALATYIAVLELVGGTLLALGLLTRLVAVQVVGFMAVATFHVLWGKGFFWTQGGYEYSLLLGLLAVAIAIKGGGRYSLDRVIGREV